MKKILLFALNILMINQVVVAQCNVDAMAVGEGMHPTPLPSGSLGVPYNQSVTLVFPHRKDTTISVPGFGSQAFTAYFTSIKVTQTSGIPQGMTFPLSSCSVANCDFPISQTNFANNRGCLLLSGNPTETGTFQVTTTNYAYGYTIMPFSIPLTGPNAGDTINFDSPMANSVPGLLGLVSGIRTSTFSSPLNIQTTSTSKRNQIQNVSLFPNPGSNSMLKFHTQFTETTNLSIRNSLGQKLFQLNLVSNVGENRIELPKLPSGIYYVSLQQGESFENIKWIVE